MKYEDIISGIKRKEFAPIYTLCGTEAFFIDEIEKTILNYAFEGVEKEFNLNIFYGKDCSVNMIHDAASRYPVMAERQVVIVREAQLLRNFEQLEQYALRSVDTTVLVLLYKHGKPNGNMKVTKALKKSPNIFYESKQLYDNQVPGWIAHNLKSRGYSISQMNAHLLAEYLGADLSKILLELDKLMINVEEKSEITSELIEMHVGISNDYNIFKLQTALDEKDASKLFRIIQYYSSDIKNHHPIMIIGVLYAYYSKLLAIKSLKGESKTNVKKKTGLFSDFIFNKYVQSAHQYSVQEVSLIIETLLEFDLKSKGVGNKNIPPEELLKEMTYRLLYVTPVSYTFMSDE